MKSEKRQELIKTLEIGVTCISAYMVRYYMANILSVISPEILEQGIFTKEFLGLLSSAYMLLYAVGQLVNGVVGDIVKPKRMIVSGMMLCGIAAIFFTIIDNPTIKVIFYGSIGFFLSMLRGPLVKTISENTSPKHSRVICTFFSFSSFAGPLIASLISMFFNWKNTFLIAGIMAVIIGILAYIVFTIFEKRGQISYTLSKNTDGFRNILKVFSLKNFKFYMYVVLLTEFTFVVVTFWLPTYMTEKLGFEPNMSKSIFSVISFIKSFTPFITLFFFNLFKEKDIKMMSYSFLSGSLFIVGMWVFEVPYLNVLFILLSQIAIGTASSLVWSIYIPSQRKSGMVSSINGILDFTGYLFSSFATVIFSSLIGPLGWGAIIGFWLILTLSGSVVAYIANRKNEIAENV